MSPGCAALFRNRANWVTPCGAPEISFLGISEFSRARIGSTYCGALHSVRENGGAPPPGNFWRRMPGASAWDSAAPNLKLGSIQCAGNLPRFAKSARLAKTRTSYLAVASQLCPPTSRSVRNKQCLAMCVDAVNLESGSLKLSPISNRIGNRVASEPIMVGLII